MTYGGAGGAWRINKDSYVGGGGEDEVGGGTRKEGSPFQKSRRGVNCKSVKSPCWAQFCDSHPNVQCHLNAATARCPLCSSLIWWRQPPQPITARWCWLSCSPPRAPVPAAAALSSWPGRIGRLAAGQRHFPGRRRNGLRRWGRAAACPFDEGHSPTCPVRPPGPSWWGAAWCCCWSEDAWSCQRARSSASQWWGRLSPPGFWPAAHARSSADNEASGGSTSLLNMSHNQSTISQCSFRNNKESQQGTAGRDLTWVYKCGNVKYFLDFLEKLILTSWWA